MILAAALSLALLDPVTPSYDFPASPPETYQVQLKFQGFIPLLGGQEGTAEVDFSMAVNGVAAGSDGMPRVAGSLTSFKALFNDAELPVKLEDAQNYFPKTTITMTPQGKVLSTDAPDVPVPVKLPGMDVKRLRWSFRRTRSQWERPGRIRNRSVGPMFPTP